jgi:hypothetical protein
MKRRFIPIRLIRVIRGCFSQRQKIARATSATRTPSNGLETASQKGTSQPEWWAVRVRSPRLLCVAACTELNQLQRQGPSPATRTVAQPGFVFMLCISSIRTSTFQKTRTLLRCACWRSPRRITCPPVSMGSSRRVFGSADRSGADRTSDRAGVSQE